MRTYAGSELRNVALVGHAHCGKTSLISAILRTAKMPAASTRGDNGAAVTAYDEEEIARGMTMSNAVAFAEWSGQGQPGRYSRLSYVCSRGARRDAAGGDGGDRDQRAERH